MVAKIAKRGTLKRLRILLDIFWRNSRYGRWLFWITVIPGFHLFTQLCFKLDRVFFPGLKHVKVEKPVFIVGHPRSGTTFFHKQIYKAGCVTSFTTWEIIFPSILQRKLFAPLLTFLKFLRVDLIQGGQKGHEIRLRQIEEDEALFLHRLDTEMVTALCPWLLIDAKYSQVGLTLGWNDQLRTHRSLRFYRECLKRQIYYSNKKQIVTKCNPSIFRIKHLLREFPDARIVYLSRSPYKSITSFFSFMYRVVEPLLTRKQQKRYFEEKYKWSIAFYRYFKKMKSAIPAKQLLIVPFNTMTANLPETLQLFFDFLGCPPPEGYQYRMRQMQFKGNAKKHTNYPLESFGITRAKIEDDLHG